MKLDDYYRYYKELEKEGFLEFTSRKELIEYLAERFSQEYAYYLKTKFAVATDKNVRWELKQRLDKEVILVRKYFRVCLEDMVPAGKRGIFKKAQKKVIIDSYDHSEVYEFVIAKLQRSDISFKDVFFSTDRYTIVGSNRLEKDKV